MVGPIERRTGITQDPAGRAVRDDRYTPIEHDGNGQASMPTDAHGSSTGVGQHQTRGHAPTGAEAGGLPVPEAEGAHPEPRRSLMRWLTRASVAGAVVSVLVHLFAGLVASLLVVRYPDADAGGTIEGAEVEFAVMTENELAAVLAPAQESQQPLVPESDTALDPVATELMEFTPSSSESLTESTLDVEIDAGAGDVGDDPGGGLTGGAGGGGGASFFGLEAQGSRFAYIVDRSSSMRGAKMSRTRAELSQSVSGLTENGEFLIVFYSDEPEALGGRARWRDASERSKEEARRLISSVVPVGGTKPLPAFELVFGQRVKPDAIYFMTDGRFGDDVPGRIESMNRRYRIPIHCILFGKSTQNSALMQDVRAMMQRISDDSEGRFRHVEIRE